MSWQTDKWYQKCHSTKCLSSKMPSKYNKKQHKELADYHFSILLSIRASWVHFVCSFCPLYHIKNKLLKHLLIVKHCIYLLSWTLDWYQADRKTNQHKQDVFFSACLDPASLAGIITVQHVCAVLWASACFFPVRATSLTIEEHISSIFTSKWSFN